MNFIRRIFSYAAKPLARFYLRKERTFSFDGIRIRILPGVFHPGLFYSTRFLLTHLSGFDLKNKTLLEPGAGSGLISFWAEQRGAVVTAAELSGQALRGLELNRDALSSHIRIFRSDVLDQVPPQPYDFIVINPPYFPKAVHEEWELSWYCGEHHEFFIRLFSKLIEFVHGETKVLMVLSEDCDIFTITKLARLSGWDVAECARKKIWLEWNYIFECRRHLVQPQSQHD